jgi:uncharacterized protein with GYD domain
MSKYMYELSYSSGSWARMLRVTDDRVKAFNALTESLGGSLDSAYWDVSGHAAYAIADMPDSAAASAVAAVVAQTGACKKIEVHEVFTQDQFTGMLQLAENAKSTYKVPGAAAVASDYSGSAY